MQDIHALYCTKIVPAHCQYHSAGLVEEMHLAIPPFRTGSRDRLFSGEDMSSHGNECIEHVATHKATHVALKRARRLSEQLVCSEASGISRTVLRSFEKNSVFFLTRRVVTMRRLPAAAAQITRTGSSR